MELGTILLKTDTTGDTVLLKGVTPAQVKFLIHEHQKKGGYMPVLSLEITGEVERLVVEEKERLKEIYYERRDPKLPSVEKLFPGVSPQMPLTFAEVTTTDGKRAFAKNGGLLKTIEVGGKTYTNEEIAALVQKSEEPKPAAPRVMPKAVAKPVSED